MSDPSPAPLCPGAPFRRLMAISPLLLMCAFVLPACCLFGCGGGAGKAPAGGETPAPETAQVTITNSQQQSFTVTAELAVTREEKMQGLSNRDTLGEDKGMLFIYESEGVYSFWMKETLLPLDMIYIDLEGMIVDINHSAEPGDLNPFSPIEPAKYVLEVNGGYCKARDIDKGDSVTIPPLD